MRGADIITGTCSFWSCNADNCCCCCCEDGSDGFDLLLTAGDSKLIIQESLVPLFGVGTNGSNSEKSWDFDRDCCNGVCGTMGGKLLLLDDEGRGTAK